MSKAKERQAAMERARHLIQSEGAEAAATALISICRDPKSPAPARSTAGTSLLRAAGFFSEEATAPQKETHQMTADELADHIARLQEDIDAMLREASEYKENAFD